MGESVAAVLEQRARAGLVGRANELSILRGCLDPDGPLVTAIHGLAGVGKSTLLDAFLADARAAGATVIRLDGRTFEPTEIGFMRAIARAIRAEADERETIIERLADVGDPVVLAIDTYEVLRLLESWLRLTFVPSLPPNTRLVLATRDDPFGWSSGPLSSFRAVPLASLHEAEAERLLTDAGLDTRTAARVNRLARGHPLALTIAAAALREQPDLVIEDVAPSRMFDAFARAYVAYLDPATRQALEATSVIRRATVSVLGAMLPDAAPHDAIERLRRLPFVEALHDGLALHETVQAATSAWLHANDPRRYRRLKLAAWRQTARRGCRSDPVRAVALYRRHAVAPRSAGRPGGVLPIGPAALLAGNGTAR